MTKTPPLWSLASEKRYLELSRILLEGNPETKVATLFASKKQVKQDAECYSANSSSGQNCSLHCFVCNYNVRFVDRRFRSSPRLPVTVNECMCFFAKKYSSHTRDNGRSMMWQFQGNPRCCSIKIPLDHTTFIPLRRRLLLLLQVKSKTLCI
jgi:hypothetical protein